MVRRKGFTLVSSVAEAKNKDESYKYLNTASKFDPKQITGDYYGFLKGDDLIAVGTASEAMRIANRYRELGRRPGFVLPTIWRNSA